MQSKIDGYIIGVKPYKERDCIITILTHKGIKTIFGRSYRSPKSKYHALNNMFLKVNLIGKDSKNFVVYDYDILDYSFVNAYNYDDMLKLFKIINLIKKNDMNDEKIYNYFEYILKNIREDKNDNFLTWFMTKILKNNNVNINFKSCVVCNNKKDIKTLSLGDGGLICINCYTNQGILKIEEIKMINLIFNGKIKDVELLKISNVIKKEIELLLNESLGLYIKE